MNARADDNAMPNVLQDLLLGATLLWIPKLKYAYPDYGRGPCGSGITAARIRRLEKAGVLRNIGVDRYAFVERKDRTK